METATFVKPVQITAKKLSKFTKIITHVNDTQPYKISCSSSTSFVRYKNNKFLTNYLLRIIISSTCVIFLVNLDDFFGVVYTDFHEVVVCTRYVPHFFYLDFLQVCTQGLTCAKLLPTPIDFLSVDCGPEV